MIEGIDDKNNKSQDKETKQCIVSDCSEEQIIGINLCEEHFLENGHFQSPTQRKRLKMIISYFRSLSDEDLLQSSAKFMHPQGGVMFDLFFGKIKLGIAIKQVNSIAAAANIPLLDTKIPMTDDEKRRRRWGKKVDDLSKCWECQSVDEDDCNYLDGALVCDHCTIQRRWGEKVDDLSKCWECQSVDEDDCNYLDGALVCDHCTIYSRHPKTNKPRYEIFQKISGNCVGCSSTELVDPKLTFNGLGGSIFPAGRLCQKCVDLEVRKISQGYSDFYWCDKCDTHTTSGTYQIGHYIGETLTHCDGCHWVY
jgi:hypothetical protein